MMERAQAGGGTERRLVVVGGATLATVVAWIVWQSRGLPATPAHRVVGDSFFVPVCLAAFGAAAAASHRCSALPGLRTTWRLVAAAVAAYLLGNVVQMHYEWNGIQPFPSVADAFYLALYPLVLLGVLSVPSLRRRPNDHLRFLLDLGLVAVTAAGLILAFGLQGGGIHTNGAIVALAYPVGDIVLLVAVSLLVLRYPVAGARRPLGWLAVGFALFSVGDLVYVYMTIHGGYQGGDLVDGIWLTALALCAVAASVQTTVEQQVVVPTRTDSPRDAILPQLAVACGLVAMLYGDRHEGLYPGLMLNVLVVVIVALVSCRYWLARVEEMRARWQLDHSVLHDPLTDLPTRALMLDRADQMLARSRRDERGPALLFFDLDNFKRLNETFGHRVGDRVLQTVAVRLEAAKRDGSTVSRVGGDEFVVLLDDDPDVDPAEVARRMLAVVRSPIRLDDVDHPELVVTTSVGVAYGARRNAEELLRDAYIALYAAKDAGRNRLRVFEPQMSLGPAERVLVESELRGALERDELFLVYQPKFRLRDCAITGAEALLRWRHPERGLISPALFVDVAEEAGLIHDIGRWALAQACMTATRWPAGMTLSVNVSGRQLDDADIVDDVRAALVESGVDPARLTLEITETALVQEATTTIAVLEALKDLGVRLSIDDLGTGYSSLGYLSQFRVHQVKIDKSFVLGIGSGRHGEAIVRTLVELGHALGAETLAEGIETEEQLMFLHARGCDLGQGYLVSPPLEQEVFEALVVPASAREGAEGHARLHSLSPREAAA